LGFFDSLFLTTETLRHRGAIEIRRELGPGLLESAQAEGRVYELAKAGLRFERQRPLPVHDEEVQWIAAIDF
jgi:GxxExxY protein